MAFLFFFLSLGLSIALMVRLIMPIWETYFSKSKTPKPRKPIKLYLIGILITFIAFVVALPSPSEKQENTATTETQITENKTEEPKQEQQEPSQSEQAPKAAPTPPVTHSVARTYSGQGPNGETIKGNINRKGEKIYHVPGGRSYNKTDPEEWFFTEADAQAAGYRPAKR